MSDLDLGDSAAPETKKGAPKAPAPPKGLFSNVAKGRALVIVPEDLIARRDAMQVLEEALTTPGSVQPRVFTSINLKKLDESFVLFTATAVTRKGEMTLKLSNPTACGNHTTEATADGLGDDLDFGVVPEPVKVLDHSSIVNSLQRGIGPSWRVCFADGAVRLLNT